jgi:endonuclease/exonuclease/phosphatase family metal-dependent hydrolase
MKKYMLFLSAIIVVLLSSCGGGGNDSSDDNATSSDAYITNYGFQEAALSDIQNNTYKVHVSKLKYDEVNVPVSAVVGETQLTDYNTQNGTSYMLLPSKYYTIGKSVTLTKTHYTDDILVTLDVAAIKNDGIGNNYILPLIIKSTDANSGKNFILIHVVKTKSSGGSLQKYADLTSNEIKIMSFNVRYLTTESNILNNWEIRKEACIAMIKDQQPTVVGVQEAVFASQWSYLLAQLTGIYQGVGVGRDDGATKGETMGILYRVADVDLESSGTFWLSETPDAVSKGWGSSLYRSATWAILRIKKTGQRFCYINTHMDLSADVRAKEIPLIMARFKKYNTNGYPQFFTADCNTASDDAIFKEMKQTMNVARDEAPLTDYHITYNGWGTGNAILDNIFYSNTMTAIEYHTVIESYNSVKYLSDHYPIYSILKFAK